ncbi:MAG TPA: PIN domain-containing protein [Desulfomonilaceae bacterium]|nr:PIN domain-containing protein [Desulfomonilaceae bacterium]
MKVLLDSNIFIRDFKMASTSFQVLFDGAESFEISLLEPSLVALEVVNKYREFLQSENKKLKDTAKDIVLLREMGLVKSLKEKEIDELCQQYEDYFQSKLNYLNGEMLDPDSLSHSTLIERAVKKRKPFDEKGRGYRDALIWELILDRLDSDDDTLAFVTENTNDFADKAGDKPHPRSLHPDLIADLEDRGIDASRIHFHTSLAAFNDCHIVPLLEVEEDLKRGDESRINWALVIKEGIVDALERGDTVSTRPLRVPDGFEDPEIIGVDEVSSVELVEARKLPNGDLLVRLLATLVGEFQCSVLGIDLMEHERSRAEPYVMGSQEIVTDYFSAILMDKASVETLATLRSEDWQVTSFEVVSESE